jgi:hypothetical protein
MTVDVYAPYRAMLAGQDVPIFADQPYPGRYKMKRGGAYVPVLINFDATGTLKASVGGKIADAYQLWTHCAKHPVTKEAFDTFNATGAWPGDAPDIGHNSGDLSLAEQIKDYAAMALGWLKGVSIKDQTTADMASNYRAKLLQLKKDADEARTSEKAPHLAASKEVDEKWRKPIAEAGDAAEDIRAALTAFMVAEERRLKAEAEAKRKAEEAKAAAERERIEKERAEKMARDPIAAMTDPEPELPMAPVETETVKVQAGGQRGRKTGLRTITRYFVVNHKEALNFFADSDEVRDLIQKLSERACKAGVAVPGTERIEEKVAA